MAPARSLSSDHASLGFNAHFRGFGGETKRPCLGALADVGRTKEQTLALQSEGLPSPSTKSDGCLDGDRPDLGMVSFGKTDGQDAVGIGGLGMIIGHTGR